MKAADWTAQRGLKRKRKGKGESAEAAAEIEADGRRKEIADESIRRAEWKPKGGNKSK